MAANSKKKVVKVDNGVTLDEEQIHKFRDQIVLVINDYKSIKQGSLSNPHIQMDIADRIIRNMRLVAK